MFLGLSLSPVPHRAGMWDKNFVREDGLDLLDCMYFACNELEIFCPTISNSFFHYTTLCSSTSWGFISLLPPFCSSALCSLSCSSLDSTTHMYSSKKEPLFFPSTSLSKGPLPPPGFCSSSPLLTLNSFFYVLSLILFVFSYSVHNLVSAAEMLYFYSLSRHGNFQGCINA